VALVLVALGCSAQGDNASRRGTSDAPASGGAAGSGVQVGVGGAGGGLSIGGLGTVPTGGIGSGQECAVSQAKADLVREAVDVIMVIDTSGSMRDEAQAIEDNVNENFASILDERGVDYRVILIARHREGPRAVTGPDSTAICISSPLGGGTCPSANPTFGARFFHFNEKIESTTSLDFILSAYRGQDDSTPVAAGYAGWLRPGAKKVFLEQTDDNALLPVATFLDSLTQMAPEHFGADPAAPKFVFHSITGIAQKVPPTDPWLPNEDIVTAKCVGGGNTVANAGESYQQLSRLTGGLRFPLCEFAGFDVVFRRIAEDVITRTRVACDFDIPAPPAGKQLDLDKVAVNYTKGDGSGSVQYGQAASVTDCQADAFYIQGERIQLCPDTCALVQADTMAAVNVVFACESTIIVK
jgi:hypothetical protein